MYGDPNMVTIDDAIAVLYPNAIRLQDYIVTENDGAVSLTFWNSALGTQPTQAQLAAVTQAQVDAALFAKVRAEAKLIHTALKAENRALRAVVKLTVDELNLVRQAIATLKT